MHIYEVTVKEKSGQTLHPSLSSPTPKSRQYIIDWFGLNEPDVESYEINHIES